MTQAGSGTLWRTGPALDTLWQAWTATRGTDRLCPCMCMHFATCDAPLGWWGGKSANVAVWWPSGWPGIGHVGIPSLSNKITATQQLTLSNGDDWTRSWLTTEPLAKVRYGWRHNWNWSTVSLFCSLKVVLTLQFLDKPAYWTYTELFKATFCVQFDLFYK